MTGVGGVLFGRRFLTTTSPVSVVSFPSYSDHHVVSFLLSLLFCFKFTSLVFGLHLYVVFTSASCVVPFVSCSDVHMHRLCCLRLVRVINRLLFSIALVADEQHDFDDIKSSGLDLPSPLSVA